MTGPDGLSPAKQALLERALRARRQAAGAGRAIPRRAGAGPAPLSFAQQRMWFLQQWEPGSFTFNGARALRIRGRLDIEALRRALEAVVERHESLRTVVSGGREPVQVLLDPFSLELPVIPVAAEPELPERLRELAQEPFDLSGDLMLRPRLLELASEDHVLLLCMHHIAADAHSDRVLFSELAELYAALSSGRRPELPELPIQYADFAVWQREQLQGRRLEELTAYWARQLDGAPALLRLPTDRPRPPIQRHRGAHHRLTLPRSLGDELLALGRAQGVTFYMTMLAAFVTLLYRLSGEEDIVVGSPIAGRGAVELEGLVGFFTNTLAFRVRLDGNPSFREVLTRARETALGAYAHQDLPFEKVVEALAPKRDPSYNPIFQVNFRAQEVQRPALSLGGLDVEPIPVDIGFSRFDFALEFELRADALHGYFEYDADLFEPASVAGFEADLAALLAAVVADPEMPVLAVALPHGRTRRRATPSGRIARRSTPQG